MPKPLTDEEIEEILDAYNEIGTKAGVVEETGFSEGAVSKYVDEAEEANDPRVLDEDELEDEVDSGEWTGAGPADDIFDDDQSEMEKKDYTDMTPGDFIRYFFGEFELGVRKKWVDLQAIRADRRNALPSEDALVEDILEMNSGIGQSSYKEAVYIGDEYVAAAKKYQAQTGRGFDNTPASHAYGGRAGGGGMGPSMYDRGDGWGISGVGGGLGGNRGEESQVFSMMMDEIRSMREEMRQLRNAESQKSSGQSTIERLQELQQQKEIWEEVLGPGDDEVAQINQRINQLVEAIASNQSNDAHAMMGGEQSLDDRLIALAAKNPDRLGEILDIIEKRSGVEQTPTAVEKQWDYKMKQADLEHEEKKVERYGEIGEKLTQTLGEAFGNALIGNGSSDDSEEVQEAHHADPVNNGGGELIVENSEAPPTEVEDCPECGEPMIRTSMGTFCKECEFGVTQCDQCSSPIELPARGNSDLGYCPECKDVIDLDLEGDDEVFCENCGFEGDVDDIILEAVYCGGCNAYRPVIRSDATEEVYDFVKEVEIANFDIGDV